VAVTSEQYDQLIRRLDLLEASLTKIVSAIPRLASLDQLRQLAFLKMADVDGLLSRMDAAENSIEIIQGVLKL
jgi:hypothetical protein